MKRDKKTGRMPPKVRNDRVLMLARQRRHVRVDGIAEHYPEKKFSFRTTCTECGIGMSYDKQTGRYIIG